MKNPLLDFLYSKLLERRRQDSTALATAMPTSEEEQALAAFIARVREMRDKVAAMMAKVLKPSAGAPTTLSPQILLKMYDEILAEYAKPKHGKLQNIARNKGKYFKRSPKGKKLHSPERSYAIVYGENINGTPEFKLYVEPKSKLFNNLKRAIQWAAGSFKKCKVAYRADVWPFIPCACLISRVYHSDKESQETIDRHTTENQLNNNMAKISPYFGWISSFIEKRSSKVSIIRDYTEHVEFDLYMLIKSGVLDEIPASQNVNPNMDPRLAALQALQLDRTPVNFAGRDITQCKLELIWHIATAINDLHKQGLVHRDIKLENILCSYDPVSKKLLVRIIDLGFATALNYKAFICGTVDYMPPELFCMINTRSGAGGLFAVLSHMLGLGASYVALDIFEHVQNVNESYATQQAKKMEKPVTTAAHDAWSTAILFYQLITGKLPARMDGRNNSINRMLRQKNLLVLEGMLNPDPDKRISVREFLLNIDPYISAAWKTVPGAPDDSVFLSINLSRKIDKLINDIQDLCATPNQTTAAEDIIRTLTYFNANIGSNIHMQVANDKIIKELETNMQNIRSAFASRDQPALTKLIAFYEAQQEILQDYLRNLSAANAKSYRVPETTNAELTLQELTLKIGFGVANILLQKLSAGKHTPNSTLPEGFIGEIEQLALAINAHIAQSFDSRFGLKP